MSDTDSVLVERDGPVTIVSINRPHCRNAVDGATARILFDTFLAFDADAAGRVAVLVPGLQLLGTALGPLCASLFLVSEDDAHSVPGVCAGFALAALCLLIAGRGCFGTRELIQNQKGSES